MLYFDDLVSAVKEFEGFRPLLYQCAGGLETIGYGFTSARVRPLPSVITLNEADDLLRSLLMHDMESFLLYVFGSTDFNRLAIDNDLYCRTVMFGFVDFIYNCGIGAFRKNFPVDKIHPDTIDLRYIKRCLNRFCYANKKRLPGLVKRRRWEYVVIESYKIPDSIYTLNDVL